MANPFSVVSTAIGPEAESSLENSYARLILALGAQVFTSTSYSTPTAVEAAVKDLETIFGRTLATKDLAHRLDSIRQREARSS